jgi:3-dehydroquinate dehydratase-2
MWARDMAKSVTKPASKTIYVLNGPNLNLLGTREPHIYGRSNLKDVEKLCRNAAAARGFAIEFRQSNHEGVIVDWIQEAGANKIAGVVLNPGGLTHTSVSVHDAIKGIRVPVIETHISNIHAREPWRNHSYVSFAAKAVICGFGIQDYALAIDGIASMSGKTSNR